MFVLFLLFSSVIGIFISIILNLQHGRNKSANLLISLFVLFHSILIADFGFYFSNYSYQLPHSLFLSTTFSLLYGPLLYFYFKKMVILFTLYLLHLYLLHVYYYYTYILTTLIYLLHLYTYYYTYILINTPILTTLFK